MKVVLALLHLSQLRNFESVVSALVEAGHEVVIAAEEADGLGGDAMAASLSSQYARVSVVRLPALDHEPGVDLGRRLRVALDFFRFHEEPYVRAAKLRIRLEDKVPVLALWLSRAVGRRLTARILDRIQRELPVSRTLADWLVGRHADVVVLAALTHYRSVSHDVQLAAESVGVPTVACIYSWDHLSSKAKLRRAASRVVVWNPTQAHEAVALHAVPPERVAVTGAQGFDRWFDGRPTRDRASFTADCGLRADAPFILYVCSALTPSPDEPGFVQSWIAALRRSADPTLRRLGVLIRPHPERLREWAGVDLSAFENVTIRPGNPLDAEEKSNYFDAIWHSSAVVGLVTSAFLEAAILRKPVFAVTPVGFESHQRDMQHFRYLLEVAGGLPAVAQTLDEHLAQLSSVLGGDDTWKARQDRFLEAFVRPGGLDVPATPRVVARIEEAAAARHVPPPWPVVSWVGAGATRVCSWKVVQRALLDRNERRHRAGVAAKARSKRRKSRARAWRQLRAAVLTRIGLGRAPGDGTAQGPDGGVS